MGMYTWMSKGDFAKYSKLSDNELNEVFQEVREIFPQLYISERKITTKGWFKTTTSTTYGLYTRVRKNGAEVKCLNITSSNKDYVLNFLFGVLNGYNWKVKSKPRKKREKI